MRLLAFFHYNPIELFPPAQNLIRFLSKQGKFRIQIYTTYPPERIELFKTDELKDVRIVRVGKDNSASTLWVRLFTYARFHVVSLSSVLRFRPQLIMYVESFSAVIPLLLKQYIRRKAGLFIHYHEYMSPEDYSRSAILKFIYRWEKRMLSKAEWVSHTNKDRMSLFLKDVGLEDDRVRSQIMPNYPPESWAGKYHKSAWAPGTFLKLVYVGAVGQEGLYFREVFQWVSSMGGRCILDVYSNQSVDELEDLVKREHFQYISFKPPVPYLQLPQVLINYDIGLILYKDGELNFRYNAPNKLFEYLNAGLDVWFPGHMLGVLPYIQTQCHPMVIPVDFGKLNTDTLSTLYTNNHDCFRPVKYQAEEVFAPLGNALMQYSA